MLKKYSLKIFPYFAAIISGGLFYYLANLFDEKYSDLLINISATFFAIPLLFFFYGVANSFSHKKLNKEIIDYAKMQADREILSILLQLIKLVSDYRNKDLSNKAINMFLSLKKEDLEKQFIENKYIGFQIFKQWEINKTSLNDLLKNPFILDGMEDEQIISIIKMLKSLNGLEEFQKRNNDYRELYIEIEENISNFKIQSGKDLNPENKKFPDRYILLKHLQNDEFVVYDFGDIPKYNLDKCLKCYKVEKHQVKDYSSIIHDLINSVNQWLRSTGYEFIIDSQMFKMRKIKL